MTAAAVSDMPAAMAVLVLLPSGFGLMFVLSDNGGETEDGGDAGE